MQTLFSSANRMRLLNDDKMSSSVGAARLVVPISIGGIREIYDA
jgi:hypothetical protein